MVYRIFVERRDGFALEADRICSDLKVNLEVLGLDGVRVVNRYDVEGVDEDILRMAAKTVFSEPQTDVIIDEVCVGEGERVFAFEFLPGQFDQRADSCEQCIALINNGVRPKVRSAVVYLLKGDVDDEQFEKIKKYVINPVESREASFDVPLTLADNFDAPDSVAVMDGFIGLDEMGLKSFLSEYSLAMDYDDVVFCQGYFRDEEKRDPTMTEVRLIDSYWSDHCRHTTFLTSIDGVDISDPVIRKTYDDYISKREFLYAGRKKSINLMDIATIAGKYLKKTGKLKNLDESEEINACSVKIKVDVDGEEQDWLLMFKNETHNHPTEIEPFGGAATCLGGAIRDPLSGRAYVYQAMRVTGAADPRLPVSETMPGKLPQSKITLGAAAGYSSYGNQIGLATGGVYEVYHPNYVAKRLEIGAVVGAAPESNVIREVPEAGDVVILLGGRTGRDGCGGATGSSKAHTSDSLSSCGAEVQKGNPPEERKIQRLFRNSEVTRLIRRCNDFGAGGVSVAIGELADGLAIDLSKVPKKYEGLDGTELAISESQERMAVVVRASDAEKFIGFASKENLEATVVAEVQAEPRLSMNWNGNTVVNLSREFLNSNGAEKHTNIKINEIADSDSLIKGTAREIYENNKNNLKGAFTALMSDLNVCSKRGLSEKFDSSVGAATVVMPFGGKYQITAPQYMAAKVPLDKGETDTCSCMAYGFDPYLSEKSPYHGAMYAVVESVSRLVAGGLPYQDIYLTLQEYFERTKNDPERWGKPFAALLGAYKAQTALELAAIGGKDSMSGTFENIDVPPTLVSFAVAAGKASAVITPEFKSAATRVYLLSPAYDKNSVPDFDSLKILYNYIHQNIKSGNITSAWAVGNGGVAEGIVKMCLGNGIGFNFNMIESGDFGCYFDRMYGSFIVESEIPLDGAFTGEKVLIGMTSMQPSVTIGGCEISLAELRDTWEAPLESVFPMNVKKAKNSVVPPIYEYTKRNISKPAVRVASPKVIIPVFPGTNCEYDTARAFEKAGASADIFVLRNYNPQALTESIDEFAEKIRNSQIFMLPGGFSGGDEPDGSGKFITAVLRNPKIKEAVTDLIENRDGLVLGICNGFQALLKSGLLPFGRILDVLDPDAATLTYNTIGRHQSKMVYTQIASVKSPWLSNSDCGDIHVVPISHGEGRFIASQPLISQLAENGQIATQYVAADGMPTMDIEYNPNGSIMAIEGITSPDGRIFGKMAHSERMGTNIAKNIIGVKDQKIFKSGVEYFK